MSFFTKYEALCKERNESATGVGLKLGVSRGTITKWRNGSLPSIETITAIAKYFSVSTDYLLDNTNIKNPPNKQEPDDIAKIALFGGDTDVTDEMWQEAKNYAEYIKQKYFKD